MNFEMDWEPRDETLRTCTNCGDQDTANPSGICDSCKRQQEIDDGPDCCSHGIHLADECPECEKEWG